VLADIYGVPGSAGSCRVLGAHWRMNGKAIVGSQRPTAGTDALDELGRRLGGLRSFVGRRGICPVVGRHSQRYPERHRLAVCFGDLGRICEPGKPSGSAGVRGVTTSSIHTRHPWPIPAIQCYPDSSRSSSTRPTRSVHGVNAAGGNQRPQNRRRPSRCQTLQRRPADHQLLPNRFHARWWRQRDRCPGCKPRLACKLGQIPAYSVSTEAVKAALQVTPAPSIPNEYEAGPLRLLALAYPGSQKGFRNWRKQRSVHHAAGTESRASVDTARLQSNRTAEPPSAD